MKNKVFASIAIAILLLVRSPLVFANIDSIEFFFGNDPQMVNEVNEILCSDLSFVYFSDLHNGWRNLAKMIEVSNELGVDAMINAGDTVLKYLHDSDTDFSWYSSMIEELQADMIISVGNHDVWDDEYWKIADSKTIYTDIILPAISKITGVCQPEDALDQGLCYYYKDYKNVRIIVLNAMSGDESVDFWDEREAEWLKTVLVDALQNNKQVICVSHAPFSKDIVVRDNTSNWNSCFDYSTSEEYDGIHTNNEAVDIVQAYIDNGGIFICWLSGHTHSDELLTATGYEGQLMIGISSARYSFHDDGEVCEDKTKSQFYCFDYLGIDLDEGLLKIVRFGWNQDISQKKRKVLCYDYINKQIIIQ